MAGGVAGCQVSPEVGGQGVRGEQLHMPEVAGRVGGALPADFQVVI